MTKFVGVFTGNQKRMHVLKGTRELYIDERGFYHRIDGPAVVDYDYSSFWYFHGTKIFSYKQFQEKTGHSDEYITYLKLKYGAIDV